MRKDESPLRIAELVPIEMLERLRRLFKGCTGVPMVFTDAEGVAVAEVEEPLRYCGSLVCGQAPGTLCLRRKQWDVPEPEVERALRQEEEPGQPVHHRCRGGFRDSAVPIVVESQTIGYAVFARSLAKPPDIDKFRELAVQGGMAPEVGEQVAQQALIMPREKIAEVAEFLQVLASLVASAAYDTLRAEQVLQLEKLRDDLIHMIVHDLRTPLTSIIGSLHTILGTDYDSEITREFVPSSLDSANTLLEMVNTLLDINKMESGQMKLELSPVDFAEIAEAALGQVKGLARERGQELSTDIDPNCPVIKADREKLRRVVVNLLGNAIKFTQDGGQIKLSARCQDGSLLFSVSDNGPGIPPEYRAKIFEKFGQAETQQGGHQHSTGLGLTFCKMVAEAHGGRIWVESEVGKGSTFSVLIPAAPKPNSQE